jgi:riboflavin synthase
VNLERAMRPGDRFGGHFVQGHVDATLEVLDFRRAGSDHRLEVALPRGAGGFLIPKGSVCLDGISLTAAEVTKKSLVCWIIPHTLEVTSLKAVRAGDRMNVEWDMLGKYVSALLAAKAPARQGKRKKS